MFYYSYNIQSNLPTCDFIFVTLPPKPSLKLRLQMRIISDNWHLAIFKASLLWKDNNLASINNSQLKLGE